MFKHKRKDFQIKEGQDNRNIKSDKAYQRLLKGNSSSIQLSLNKLFEALEALDEFSDVRLLGTCILTVYKGHQQLLNKQQSDRI